MKVKLIAKIFATFLIVSVFTSIFNITEANNTETNKHFYVNSEEYLTNEITTGQKSLKEQEKIMEYDAQTGKTKEVDMNKLRKKTMLMNKKSANFQINSLDSYQPVKTKHTLDLRAGTFTLQRVADVTRLPYRANCRVKYEVYGEEGVGSGSLVGPKLVLTAAHCVMNRNDSDQFFAEWNAYPAYNNGPYNNLGCGWAKIYYSSLWLSTHEPEYDWCICVLYDDLGEKVGYHGLTSYGNNSEMERLLIRGYGYPIDPGEGKYQYLTFGTLTDIQDGYFITNATVRSGMSGGPMCRTTDEYIIGIIKAANSTSTQAVRISQNIIDIIRENR